MTRPVDVARRLLANTRHLQPGRISTIAGCTMYGHRYSTACFPPACIRCGRSITHPYR